MCAWKHNKLGTPGALSLQANGGKNFAMWFISVDMLTSDDAPRTMSIVYHYNEVMCG